MDEVFTYASIVLGMKLQIRSRCGNERGSASKGGDGGDDTLGVMRCGGVVKG